MQEFATYRVKHVMTKKTVTVRVDTPLSVVGELFEQHDFNALPVLGGDGNIAGSREDVLRAIRHAAAGESAPASPNGRV